MGIEFDQAVLAFDAPGKVRGDQVQAFEVVLRGSAKESLSGFLDVVRRSDDGGQGPLGSDSVGEVNAEDFGEFGTVAIDGARRLGVVDGVGGSRDRPRVERGVGVELASGR
ncbi:hypothetical protein AB0K52_21920 [Glycomyces sp. NPDC049804]|uniref:hypothetical protein n=1 Tax=Glycomyces sp. NPDC049804 TaxID=3154363 RepID=UPI003412787A